MTDKLVLSMKLIEAYNKLLHRVYDACAEAGDKLKPNLEKRLEDAAALDELSNEVSDYLRRDIKAAAQWMANNENAELSDWLRFDIEQVESRVLSAFSQLADQTTLELKQLEQTANEVGEWHTGEIVGIGSLTCLDCGEEIHFHSTGHVPPCPQCHGTRFKRHS
jgi:hypothetical protein